VVQVTPVLNESQIGRIAETAKLLVSSLPPPSGDPKTPNHNKKKVSKEVETVMGMRDDDPMKIEEIRRFSAIYGRFDCKRKPQKPLTMHEVSVNEAAAQLCLQMPTLLTRRDELFPLARQVVRESGYQYSKGHSRSQFSQTGFPSKLFGTNVNIAGTPGTPPGANGEREHPSPLAGTVGKIEGKQPRKRQRISDNDFLQQKRRERVEQITEELRGLIQRMDELRGAAGAAGTTNDTAALAQISQQLEVITVRHNSLIQEQRDLAAILSSANSAVRVGSTSSEGGVEKTNNERGGGSEVDEMDSASSQRSYSTASPVMLPASAPATQSSPGNFVLSASGGQIIAVQNPALTLSGAASLASLASAHSGGGRVGVVPGSSNSALSPQPPPPPLLTITSQGGASITNSRSVTESNPLLASHLAQVSAAVTADGAGGRHGLDVKPYVTAALLNLSRQRVAQAASGSFPGVPSDQQLPSSSCPVSPPSSRLLTIHRNPVDEENTAAAKHQQQQEVGRVKEEPNSNPSSPISVGHTTPPPPNTSADNGE